MRSSQVVVLFASSFLLAGCMSQVAATKEPVHEFVRDLPNRSETEVRAGVARWSYGESFPIRTATESRESEGGTIVCEGDMEIRPDGSRSPLEVAFTMNIDVKDNRIRVRFADLRRMFGARMYQAASNDAFFKTSTGAPYEKAARLKFAGLVKSLTDSIIPPAGDVASKD